MGNGFFLSLCVVILTCGDEVMALLEVRGLTKNFGGLAAVSGLDFDVNEGEILGIIGPNGAGKSTVFNLICGSIPPTSGRLTFQGRDITGLPPHQIAKRGITRMFQGNALFPNFTVITNVLAAFHLNTNLGAFGFLFGSPSANRREKILYSKAMEILEFVDLADEAERIASSQPHGNQRHLCLAIALAAEPKLLLLDEPVTGMNDEEVTGMLAMIRTLREKRGITCIIVEHNMKAVMGLCDRIVTICYGKKIAQGSPQEISVNPAVIEAYLGA
jgi:branched-chain amino acid transport system ATP-binding protein